MDTLPFREEFITPLDHFSHQPPLVRFPDADEVDRFGAAVGASQVDLRLSGAGDMNMCRLMIGCVDDEPESMGAVNDNHGTIYNLTVGLIKMP